MDFLSSSISYVAQVIGFRKQSGILEIANGRSASLASVDPILMMAIQTTHVIVQVIDSYDEKIGLRVLRPWAQQ